MPERVEIEALPPDHPLRSLSADKFAKKAPPSKFSPKLEFAERCAALALVRAGVDVRIVAAALDVDRRTVRHIANPSSVHYRQVRKEMENLGTIDFTVKYVTPEIVAKVEAAKIDPVIEQDDKEVVQARTAQDGRPNPRARGMAGIHVVRPEHCRMDHRIEIAYREADDVAETVEGWHYRDLDSEMPDTWLHCGEESLLTSQNCKRMAEVNITDD